MNPDDLFALFGLAAIFMHATVSFRNASWLPVWLGQGLSESHSSVHLRVAGANFYYACLLIWLTWDRIPEPSFLLRMVFVMGIIFCTTQVIIRFNKAMDS